MKMNKKWSALIVSCVLSTVVIAGCSNNTNATNGNGNSSQQQASGTQQKGMFQRPDLSGEVTTVNGNEVTIKVIELPQWNGRNRRGGNQENQPPANQQG